MVEKVDVGETIKEQKPKENKKVFPSLFLSTEQVSKLKDKNVGDTGSLIADYKITGKRIDDEKHEKYDIEILKIGLSKKSAKENDDEETNEEENEKLRGKTKERLQRGKET